MVVPLGCHGYLPDRCYLAGLSSYGINCRHHGWRPDGYTDVFECLADHLAESKIIVESNQGVQAGNEPNPEAAAAAPKAALASRTNTLFSMPMLYLMGSSAHLSSGSLASSTTAVWVCVAIVAALEANAIFGKQGPLTTVRGVIHCGLALTVVLVAILNFL